MGSHLDSLGRYRKREERYGRTYDTVHQLNTHDTLVDTFSPLFYHLVYSEHRVCVYTYFVYDTFIALSLSPFRTV